MTNFKNGQEFWVKLKVTNEKYENGLLCEFGDGIEVFFTKEELLKLKSNGNLKSDDEVKWAW